MARDLAEMMVRGKRRQQAGRSGMTIYVVASCMLVNLIMALPCIESFGYFLFIEFHEGVLNQAWLVATKIHVDLITIGVGPLSLHIMP